MLEIRTALSYFFVVPASYPFYVGLFLHSIFLAFCTLNVSLSKAGFA